jgi:hypothetical protein
VIKIFIWLPLAGTSHEESAAVFYVKILQECMSLGNQCRVGLLISLIYYEVTTSRIFQKTFARYFVRYEEHFGNDQHLTTTYAVLENIYEGSFREDRMLMN